MSSAIHQLYGDDRVKAGKLGDGEFLGFKNSTGGPLTVVFEPVWEELCVLSPGETITVELIYTDDLPAKPENWFHFDVGDGHCIIWQQHGTATDFAWTVKAS